MYKKFFLATLTHNLGYPDLYLMKLINSHVTTIDGVGDLLEAEMNSYRMKIKDPVDQPAKYSSITMGPCPSYIVVCLTISDLSPLLYLNLF